MDFSAFRSLKPSSWRSVPSGSISHSEAQKQIPNSLVATSDGNTKHKNRVPDALTLTSDLPELPEIDKFSGVREMFRRDKGKGKVTSGQLSRSTNVDSPSSQNHRLATVMPVDPVEKVKGMYRLLDLIGESGSNGYVDKVVIAQNSIQRFINSISPGAFASITRVDFKTLDRFMIKPFGVYGSKDEIVRLLLEIGAIDDNVASLLLAPAGSGDSQSTLSSGLYIVRANVSDLADERHFVVYWPEDTTWNDSATSSVRRNRITFMRYLTKICDQVLALLSREHATAIVWSDQDSDAECVDMETCDSDRLFTFEVAETNEQEEKAVACPGFQMNSRYILPSEYSPDCPVDPSALVPRLLPGETTQGFCTVSYVQRQSYSEDLYELTLSRLSFRRLLIDNALVLSEELEESAVQALVNVAIADLFPELCDKWHVTNHDIRSRYKKELEKRMDTIHQEIVKGLHSLQCALREVVVEDVLRLFPSLERDNISASVQNSSHPAVQESTGSMRLSDLESLYPGFRIVYQKYLHDARFDLVLRRDPGFESRKLRLLAVLYLLEKYQGLDPRARAELTNDVLVEGDFRFQQQTLSGTEKKRTSKSLWGARSLLSVSGSSEDSWEKEMRTLAARVPDAQFLLMIKTLKSEGNEDLRPVIDEVEALAHTQLVASIDEVVRTMAHAVSTMQQEHCERAVQHETNSEERKSRNEVLTKFIQDINAQTAARQDSVVYLDGVVTIQTVGSRDPTPHSERFDAGMAKHSSWSTSRYGQEYVIIGRRQIIEDSKLEFCVYLMDLTSDDKHSMQLNPDYIPSPVVNERLSSKFHIPLSMNIAFHQILENGKLLLILLDRGRISIYIDHLHAIDLAIRRERPVKNLNREKLGNDALFAFDESRRSLAVCASTKLKLHMFVFDENYRTLQAQGTAVNLAPWYSQTEISILHTAFVCGNEEVVLVDSSSQARIFSFVTLQFRPATLQLPSIPSSIFSSPDGSCLLVYHTQGSKPILTVYHWETFGSTAGVRLDVPDFPLHGAFLTSVVDRGRVFLMGLDISSGSVKSITVKITKKHTEFMFKENGNRNGSNNRTRHALHNSLLDCHAEVWSRFPVVPAVQRRTLISSRERQEKSITFIAENHSHPFESYFSNLIQNFERTTRKPTGDELRRIKVSAKEFTAFRDEVIVNSDWDVSRHRIGEWLVDLLCLIPIHIAVCRENRFVPLADGVLSSDLERSLLGAEVSKIVDKLSFGWYESIFQSYLASKPVKVVSSMGQQSVGKSYSLNHLLDTSFAGSAMRTTEGVWLSVTPTDDALIVALDFEGVDSVERSLQEDTLLVLFNTAISNLVLFRNNFAFSRDISGLFQSFQSSSSVLDPAANPTLFQSTLVIIIKDVVEADKVEITREFSLKFQKIVQQEQRANFISRLHRGKLDIIPWPVIESKEFYKLFPTLKKRLDSQNASYPTAGEFLHTIKTLMAKLKANDWGALSQTMTEHRARTLFNLLPIALATGYSEVEPETEPLKNLDTDTVIEGDDTPARFAISERENISPADIEMHLTILRGSWSRDTPRQSIPDSDWTSKLASYISGSIDLRVYHVRLWLDSNLERFHAAHSAVEDLRRRFDNMVIEMRTNTQLCRAQCPSCHLLCVRSRLHEGDHCCETTHKCNYDCAFCKDETKPCGTPAGHPGEHVCVINAHLCGGPCKLSGHRGCLQDCTKVAGHVEDEHKCSALVHMCSMPCALQGMKLPGGKTYSCQEVCSMPSDQPHEVHSCDMRLCPMTCDLCRRLCVEPHIHGLEAGSFHLCGEAHPCSALCSTPGICQIDTTPLSVEATFTGKHETFQYTKYSQVAKRLQCVTTIEPGQTSHAGPHLHTKDERPFHFCEARCINCGYFCTLPLGHAQREHETSHGSMTQTRWAIDGPDESDIELGGRKFSANDEGAPMMCNLVCSSIGRHVHIEYCRTGRNGRCEGAELQHVNTRMIPNPDRPKDAITHNLYWRRLGFKDPYTRDEQIAFAKCDAMCPGPEHFVTASSPARPSYCTLSMFHPPRGPNDRIDGNGYISNDGHLFECGNPMVSQPAFHIIFVIDRSASMSFTDRGPLVNGPATERIRRCANNRLGAVYSALYSFWTARHAAHTTIAPGPPAQQLGIRRDSVYSALYHAILSPATGSGSTAATAAPVTADQQTGGGRRDAYSIILFNMLSNIVLFDDVTSTPEQLLGVLLSESASGGTNFAAGLSAAQSVMRRGSAERLPVIIFLSDGECTVPDAQIVDICQAAIQNGKPLSFHAVSFGQNASETTLRRMADLALNLQNNAPRPTPATVPSSFATALDTVRLTETFLGIAESLRKPRGSLMH